MTKEPPTIKYSVRSNVATINGYIKVDIKVFDCRIVAQETSRLNFELCRYTELNRDRNGTVSIYYYRGEQVNVINSYFDTKNGFMNYEIEYK